MSAGNDDFGQGGLSSDGAIGMEARDADQSSASIEVLRDKLGGAEMQANRLAGEKADPWAIKLAETYIAMTAVVNFCADNDINVRPLGQLMGDLGSLALGLHPSEMLAYRGSRGRPPDHLFVEYVKGAVAATVVYCKKQGQTLKAASASISRILPEPIRDFLRSPNRPNTPTSKTIESWVALYESPQSRHSNGHRGYQMMSGRLMEAAPPVAGLKSFIEAALIGFVVSPGRVTSDKGVDGETG